MCRIVTGSSRPFRPSAQLSYTFEDQLGDLDKYELDQLDQLGYIREFVVAVTARDVCVHNLVCYSCIFTCTSF